MRIAFFSPLNPKPSGISDYSEALLLDLAKHAERLDVFIEDYTPSHFVPPGGVQIRHWQEFEPDHERGVFDIVLYHIGNNPFHVYIYDLAVRIPGVLVLHEFNLHHLLANVTIARQDWERYIRELEYNAGPAALERACQAREGFLEPDYDNVAMNRRLLECSLGAIVHSEFMVNLVRQEGFQLPVRRIPHGLAIPASNGRHARQHLADLARLRLDETTPVFGIFGFLKPYKRIHEALRSFARLRVDYPAAKMILVGEEHPRYPLRPLIAELGLQDSARILGFLLLEDFTAAMAACDFCINLRRPTAGETSGSFMRALASGKPTLVSQIGAFLELPDDVAVKIPVDGKEVDWVYESMKALLEEPDLAREIGERGRAYVAQECSWPKVAGQYMEFLQQCAGTKAEARVLTTPEGEALSGPGAPSLPRFSRDGLEEYILGFSHTSRLMEEYVLLHLERLLHTLEITPSGGAADRILEMGCYLQITPALSKYLGYGEVRGAYFGPAGGIDARSSTSASGDQFDCLIDLFDAEKDRYPYPDGHFQTVLCGELLEHLSLDPMHMMTEINRILAPGGVLVLSTPNITSLHSIHAVLQGYHPAIFHAYIKPNDDGTVDPRHSREYTPRDVAVLAEVSGFEVDLLETGDYGKLEEHAGWTRKILEASGCSTDLRGQVIYCRARKAGPVRERWPKDFYYPS